MHSGHPAVALTVAGPRSIGSVATTTPGLAPAARPVQRRPRRSCHPRAPAPPDRPRSRLGSARRPSPCPRRRPTVRSRPEGSPAPAACLARSTTSPGRGSGLDMAAAATDTAPGSTGRRSDRQSKSGPRTLPRPQRWLERHRYCRLGDGSSTHRRGAGRPGSPCQPVAGECRKGQARERPTSPTAPVPRGRVTTSK